MSVINSIFSDDKKFNAALISEDSGILSGVEGAVNLIEEIGIKDYKILDEGDSLEPGKVIAKVCGNPAQLASLEERLAGQVTKYSAIATAARSAIENAGGKVRIVCGAYKKIDYEIKEKMRQAVRTGGADTRMVEGQTFRYIDKNYIRMLGGVKKSIDHIKTSSDMVIVIQIHRALQTFEKEVEEALDSKADILMIDTGKLEDIRLCREIIEEKQPRYKPLIAYSGNVSLDSIKEYANSGDIDILDIGKAIIDSPMLDVKFEVEIE